jgi:hypothetical protein
VTADPVDPSAAYAAWDQLVSPSSHSNPSAFNHSPAFRGPSLFSKTADGGKTWSQGRTIFDPGQKNQTIGNQIVIPTAGPAKGVLIDGFDLIKTKGGKGRRPSETDSVAVVRSTNGGATWSGPIVTAQENVGHVSIAGQPVRSSDQLPEFAAGPEGNLYAVWQDARFSPDGHSKIALSMSKDAGLTWSTPIRVDQSPGDTPAFLPQIHVAPDGTVGLSYYDLENSTSARPGLTDVFIAHCHTTCDSAANWSAGGETRLSNSGPFDFTTAPDAGGLFVGDYEGLTATPDSGGPTFEPFFIEAKPIATTGSTDPFSNRAH